MAFGVQARVGLVGGTVDHVDWSLPGALLHSAKCTPHTRVPSLLPPRSLLLLPPPLLLLLPPRLLLLPLLLALVVRYVHARKLFLYSILCDATSAIG